MVFDFVFIVLVYRNTKDLEDFFDALHLHNSKVVVVNSFYDESSEKSFREIAKEHDADYISVPNKGYGAGNNRGCEYALKNYKFKYLVISNADIEVKKMLLQDISCNRITAPLIKNKRGKQQNPAKPYQNSVLDKIMYKSYKWNAYKGVLVCCFVNKILRQYFYLCNFLFGIKKIYEPHGAFLIFPYDILNKMYPLFNEDMFLFAEEDHLARLAKTKGIEIEFNKRIQVYHKEDGSVGLISEKQYDITKKSFITYYEYWEKNENS